MENTRPSAQGWCRRLVPRSLLRFDFLRRLLGGRERLGEAIRRIMVRYIQRTDDSIHNVGHDTEEPYTDNDDALLAQFLETVDLKVISAKSISSQFPSRICRSYREEGEKYIEVERMKVWNEIPGLFSVYKSWSDIREKIPVL